MSKVNPRFIIRAVSEFTYVNEADILSKKRSVYDGIILARFLIYHILRHEYKMTYTDIAKATNRKRHNTVMYALRKLEMDENKYADFLMLRQRLLNTINKTHE